MPDPTSRRLIRVDSVDEEYAYVTAFPPDERDWSIQSQLLSRAESGTVDTLRLRSADGEERDYRFDISSFFGGGHVPAPGSSTIDYLDAVMEQAGEFATMNGAHHPGSLPRFPVPSDRYPGRLDVPLPILAVDGGVRGLYAPVRIVTMTFEDPEPFGVGEFPGFDPDNWPPPRLADWPPSGIQGMGRLRLQAAIGRFSAVAVRLYSAFFSRDTYPQLGDERAGYLTLLRLLDVPQMEPYYRQVAGRFFSWLEAQDP